MSKISNSSPTVLLRRDEVLRRCGISWTTLKRWERQGIFPARRKVGPNVVAWRERDVENFLSSREVVASQ